MLVLLAALCAHALDATDTAYTGELVLAGEVLKTQTCLDPVTNDMLTFTTLEPSEVLRGSVKLDRSGLFTFRTLGGDHPDGTTSGLVGAPVFHPGDDVLVSFRIGDDGLPTFVPVPTHADASIRFFEVNEHKGNNGRTIATTADGDALVEAFGAVAPSVRLEPARHRFPHTEPPDEAAIAKAVDHFAAGASVDDIEGPWRGVISLGLVVEGTWWSCDGVVKGTVKGNGMWTTTSCQLPGYGHTEIELDISFLDGTWVATADLVTAEAWVGSASLTGERGSTDHDWWVTAAAGKAFDAPIDVSLAMTRSGPRELADKESVLGAFRAHYAGLEKPGITAITDTMTDRRCRGL
jgi:hypothetical protein